MTQRARAAAFLAALSLLLLPAAAGAVTITEFDIEPGRAAFHAPTFSLSEAATVRVAVQRRTRGRRVAGRCVRSTRRNRSRPRCTRLVTVRSVRRDGRQGANALTLATGGLGPGSYRAALTATDAAGNTSSHVDVSFTVVARRGRRSG